MTDNSLIFTMKHAYFSHRRTRFERLLQTKRIKLLLIPPHHPETNGKVERFHRTVEEEMFRLQSFLTAEQREHVANAVNINNSDVDLCEFKGKTIIYYSWGDQQGIEHPAEAVHDGTLESFLRGSFDR